MQADPRRRFDLPRPVNYLKVQLKRATTGTIVS